MYFYAHFMSLSSQNIKNINKKKRNKDKNANVIKTFRGNYAPIHLRFG